MRLKVKSSWVMAHTIWARDCLETNLEQGLHFVMLTIHALLDDHCCSVATGGVRCQLLQVTKV